MMNFAIILWLFKCSNACLTTPDMDLPPVQPTTYTGTTTSSPSTLTTTTCITTTTTTTTIDCFANSAPLAQCDAQCPPPWEFVNGKCYQFFANLITWNAAATNCRALCTPPSSMCHLPRLYSEQQGIDLVDYEIWIGTVDIRAVTEFRSVPFNSEFRAFLSNFRNSVPYSVSDLEFPIPRNSVP
ncbi:hypothetical protein WR25_27119 [Diploscapter pachys]|uniref:C-type lectin domain-containing protein n=1 Tax=Diploscapter pachys TaxID=2018661 RepID=A0A2A2L9T4_9BILA|nr:hypothetical protein WR25_27119 [Diploscapter pachys]